MRLAVLAADADLAIEVTRCLCMAFDRPEAVVAAPATVARLSRSTARTTSVPAAWFDAEPRRLVSLLLDRYGSGGEWLLVPADYDAHLFLACHGADMPGIRTIPVAEPATLVSLNDKAWLAEFAHARGIATPRTLAVREPVVPAELPFAYPVIAKPSDGCGGRGVELIANRADLARYVRDASPGPRHPVVVQDYVAGTDVGANLLAVDGQIVASCVQRHLPGRRLQFEENRAVAESARRLVSATRYTGVAHLDYIEPRDGREPLLLECNPRFWASLAASCHMGTNFAELAVRAALGERIGGDGPNPSGMIGRSPNEWARVLSGHLPSRATRAFLMQRAMDPLPGLYGKGSRLVNKVKRR